MGDIVAEVAMGYRPWRQRLPWVTGPDTEQDVLLSMY